MLSEFFAARWRIRALQDGPAGALFEGFAQALSHMRYAAITGRRHLRAAEHFIDWTNRNGLSVPDLNGRRSRDSVATWVDADATMPTQTGLMCSTAHGYF